MAEHSQLTGVDLHEPKGQAGAAANTVYVADGSGSGTHKKITLDSLDMTSVSDPNIYFLSSVIPDISTASSILIPVLETSTFISARLVLGGAITGANAGVTFIRNDGSSFGSTASIPFSSSAEGTGVTFTVTLNSQVTGPGYVKISTDGASTGTIPVYVTAKFSKIL